MNVLMYAAPLNVARVVVATESVEFMPLGLTLGTLACSASWTTYALLDATILARPTSSATRSASPRSSSTRATPAPSPPRRPRPTAAA